MIQNYNIDSLANIARDTIVRKNPFPSLEGFPSNAYASKWGLTDLYPEDEKILREAIENRKIFDTGWVGCKKEIRYFRIISNGEVMTIQTSAEMDDFEDLICDAMESEVELTEEQTEILNDYWCESDMDTSTCSEVTIPFATYETVMEHIKKMEEQDAKTLDAWFDVVKSWVKDVVSLVPACYNETKFEEENHMKTYQVIGGQYEQHHYGESDTLRGARIIAGKHKEYWDNWQGWHTPAVYLAEDCEVIEAHGMITVPDGQRVIVHKPDAEPVQ